MNIDFAVMDNCQNMDESFGEICVRCNKCGRLTRKPTEEKHTPVETKEDTE